MLTHTLWRPRCLKTHPGLRRPLSASILARWASDVSASLRRFAQLRRKAAARTGQDFPILVRTPDGLQTWRTAGVFHGQGADAAGGGEGRWPPAPATRRKAARSITSRVCPRRATHYGCRTNRPRRLHIVHRPLDGICAAAGLAIADLDVHPPKLPIPILGGILTFESDWSPPLGAVLEAALAEGEDMCRLDLGCVAADGHFARGQTTGAYELHQEGQPALAFLFKLMSQLQLSGTVADDLRASLCAMAVKLAMTPSRQGRQVKTLDADQPSAVSVATIACMTGGGTPLPRILIRSRRCFTASSR